ncbi:MAG: hypothetical protein PHQ66_03940 [Candidatus Nanoarchaeia archaeon]|nr:hypothetical protein [Candidatus Nanoarchaeia archaeon]
MTKRADPKAKARAIVADARAKAKKILADARAKAKKILADARAKAKALVAAAKARAKAKREKTKATKKRSNKKASTTKRPRERKPLTLWQRAAKMTTTEIDRTKPRIPVDAVLSTINSFYAEPDFKGPVLIAAIRSQRQALHKSDIDHQLTELARVGIIRLIRSSDLPFEVPIEARHKGYPWAAPTYVAVAKV